MDWDSSPTLDAAHARGHPPISPGFSRYHAKLLDICFGLYHPDTVRIQPVPADYLSHQDLENLAFMVLVEFAASVEKERLGTQEESQVRAEPKPYDVFVMKTSFGYRASNISVVLPMKGGQLQWWNGQGNFASLDSDEHLYRIASLSGTARVLECLHRAMNAAAGSLSVCAMRRESLFDSDKITTTTTSSPIESFLTNVDRLVVGAQSPVDPSILEPLNESQQEAVLTCASTKFQDGFFAIQGELFDLSSLDL